MKKYMSRQIELEAYQFKGWGDAIEFMNLNDSVYFVPPGYEHDLRYENEFDRSNGHLLDTARSYLVVKAEDGLMRVDHGEWIIKGEDGKLGYMSDEAFKEHFVQESSTGVINE